MRTTTILAIVAIIGAFGMLGIATGMMITAQPAHAAPGQGEGTGNGGHPFHGCAPASQGDSSSVGKCFHGF
jgi:hypothetical protein